MRVLCLTDFPVKPPDRWIWNYLPETSDHVDFLWVQPNDWSGRKGQVLTRYLRHFSTAKQVVVLADGGDYDVLIAWESKNGVPLALLRWLKQKRHPPFALLTFSAKQNAIRFRTITNRWLKYVDHLTVPSQGEATYYSRRLNLSSAQVSVCHLGAYDRQVELPSASLSAEHQQEAYLFSGGHTERDYRTLFEAIAGVGVRTTVATRQHLVKNLRIPDEARIVPLLAGKEYVTSVVQARAVILPLKPVNYAAGLSLILDAMALGRPVICSDIPAVRDYVIDGVTGYLVPPGDVGAMRNAIISLVHDPRRCEEFGQAARIRYEKYFTFPMFARRAYDVLRRVAE